MLHTCRSDTNWRPSDNDKTRGLLSKVTQPFCIVIIEALTVDVTVTSSNAEYDTLWGT